MDGSQGLETTQTDLPFREIPYLPQKLIIERRDDGAIILDNGQPLRPYHPHMLAPIVYWAATVLCTKCSTLTSQIKGMLWKIILME